MFRDPIRRYVERLRADGVPTDALEFDGMFHVFPILMPWADDSREVFRHVRRFIHRVVEDAPPLPTASCCVPSVWGTDGLARAGPFRGAP